VLAHNSVDRGFMARDSIELNLDDLTPSPGKLSRARSARTIQTNQEERLRPGATGRSRSQPRAAAPQDDAELLIDPEDLDLEELDSEEAQFLRTDRRVPVRRGPLPRKMARYLKLAGVAAAVAIVCGGVWKWAEFYGTHSWRFRVDSSDAVEISGVHNASRAQVMDVAGEIISRNVFYVPLEESKRKLEQIPWVEHASVMRLLPNRIAVTIQERTPVAFAQIGPRISLIDANGVVMGMPANRQTKYSFPVIRGIAETEPLSSRAAAMKIYNRLVSELGPGDAEGTGGGTNYVRQLSEVDLSDPEDVKVTTSDAGGTMVVYLGKTDFLARYKLYVAHIAEWRQQYQNVQSVDLKYEGQVVVNPDRPAVSEKTPPRMSTDNTDRKKTATKPAVKTVSAKTVNHKVAKPNKHSAQKTQRAQR
jgi:cell division protein FtsQ